MEPVDGKKRKIMSNGIVIMMIGVSLLLGAIGLIGVIWAIKTGQFDDKDKMMNTVLDDGEDALNEAAEKERRKKEYSQSDKN